MSVQVIMKDGRPEWAVIPYAEYEALLEKAGQVNADNAMPEVTEVTEVTEVAASSHSAAPNAPSPKAMDALAKLMSGQGAGSGTFSAQKMAVLRQSKQLELSAMSREVGVSPSYLGQIEQGERDPSDAVVRNIARALGVDINQLLD